MRLSYEGAPKIGNTLSRQTLDADARYYMRIGANGVFAVRGYGFKSWGEAPGYTYFGGNSEMRGYEYREFLGHSGFYGNAELRFPLIHAMATPIGILGGIRGVFFANIGGAALDGQPFKVWDNSHVPDSAHRARTAVIIRPRAAHRGIPAASMRARRTASGSKPSRSASRCTSTGRTGPCSTRNGKTTSIGSSDSEFRKARFTAWIGYDF